MRPESWSTNPTAFRWCSSSSILGRHLLTDVLACREQCLDAFLDRYLECVKLHKGVRAIASAAWPRLLESDLLPFMTWGDEHFREASDRP